MMLTSLNNRVPDYAAQAQGCGTGAYETAAYASGAYLAGRGVADVRRAAVSWREAVCIESLRANSKRVAMMHELAASRRSLKRKPT